MSEHAKRGATHRTWFPRRCETCGDTLPAGATVAIFGTDDPCEDASTCRACVLAALDAIDEDAASFPDLASAAEDARARFYAARPHLEPVRKP